MKVINYIVLIISIIGCVNWGLIGLFDFNLVDMLFGTGSILSRAVYILVGICGIYQLSFFMRIWLVPAALLSFLLWKYSVYRMAGFDAVCYT